MSIIGWINESVPGGVNTRLGQLLDVAYNIEYGGECSEQSALNLLYLMGYSGQGQLRLFGPSNEKYHVRGGNDLIVTRMAEQLSGQIQTGRELVAIRQTAAGGYTLTFRSGRSLQDVSVDKVVLALPFSVMRNSVDFSQAGFNAVKQIAIREQGMGTNAKFHLQFTERLWDRMGCNGDTFSDLGYQNTWHVTRGQPGVGGILNNYTGGNVGASYGGVQVSQLADRVLNQLDVVMPGIKSRWNGKATLHHWPTNPWTRGSYSYWRVGQYTRFAGAEGERSGHCHFCGEHTSIDFQGYLNGAVETGERVSNEILGDMK
jgi:monoamine oxidase